MPGAPSAEQRTCYQRLGRPAEALSGWRRCQRTLSAGSGISPSAKTEAIARQLQQQVPAFAGTGAIALLGRRRSSDLAQASEAGGIP